MLIELLRGELTQEEYLIINNARIIYKKLPKKIYGFVNKYKDIYLIVINWNISKEKKVKTILHEFAHIELHHIDRNSELYAFSIENAEDEADKYINFLLNNIKQV